MKKIKKLLYVISQTQRDGYDTYSDAVVCAPNEEEAKRIHPDCNHVWDEEREQFYMTCNDGSRVYVDSFGKWADHIDNVNVEQIGIALESQNIGVIVSSFHAG